MRILTVCAGEKSAETLTALLREQGESSVTSCLSAAEGRRMVLDEDWDITIINYPLSDEPGIDLAHMITAKTDSAVIVILKEELIPIFGRDLEEDGILYVSKPILRPILFQTIRLAFSIRERLNSKDREIKRLEGKVEEARVVGRAKCLLIEKAGFKEDAAHHLIEKTAMDRRISLKDSALLLMKKYKEL